MDWLNWVLFESVGALGAVLGTGLFVLLVIWRRGGNVKPLLIGVGLSVVLVVVQGLVVTPRERAGGILDEVQAGLLDSRVGPLEAVLSPMFAAGDLDRAAFVRNVGQVLQDIRIERLNRTKLEVVASEAGRLEVLATFFSVHTGGQLAGPHKTRWVFVFVERAEGWVIDEIVCEEVDGIENPDWTGRRL